MAIDHDVVQVAADGSGKKIGNVKVTDGDGVVVWLQKTVTWDPEDGTDAGAFRVVNGFGQVATPKAGSATVTSVADNASSVELLPANADRLGASIVNDSSAALYVEMGATASLTSYSVKLTTDSYLEVPFGYTGAIAGIWATDPDDGSARITEYT
jgi:hypothetical protein